MTNLMEIRHILNVIDSGLQTPVIPGGLWEKAKKSLVKEYSTSACLEHCLRLMEDFEISNSIKYRSDLDEFIKESNYEDFYTDEKGTVFVSTIHKAKGREFDSVYLLLNNCHPYSDEEKRRIYVGLTRAKTLLRIYCNTDLFAGCDVPEIIRKYDDRLYAEPDELMLQMSYRDVVLDFFKSRKTLTASLRSGDELQIDGPYLTAERGGRSVRAAKMSKAFYDTLDSLCGKGFRPSGAKVRFVVFWKGEGETEETPIILTDLKMVKTK